MRKGVLAAAGLASLVAVALSSAPAQAMPISAPAALNAATDSINLAEAVSCWDDCYYGPPRYYRRYYYDDGPRYYRPYYRSYYDDGPRYYRPAYVPPPWVSGPYYPRPRFYHVGPSVYWY